MAKEVDPDPAGSRFSQIARLVASGESADSAHRKGFGTRSMFVGKKMFAVLDSNGDLVVKLSPVRVQELIGTKIGHPWHPGNGVPLKEYVAVPFAHQDHWEVLAREARLYMGGKR
ncbi:MAG TPA: hypothetical protein VGV89_06040 [Thermoplasmata archaeon]|nr:hypothetical protein [Thermoplasmata archaeon]